MTLLLLAQQFPGEQSGKLDKACPILFFPFSLPACKPPVVTGVGADGTSWPVGRVTDPVAVFVLLAAMATYRAHPPAMEEV